MSGQSDDRLQRVFIWSLPRTMGTALVKCLSYIDDIQVFYEPCVTAYHFGPDADEKRRAVIAKFVEFASANRMELEHAFDHNICSYKWIKQELESEDYPGKKILLAKDQAYCLDERYDMLPTGFRYAFLIRHPYRVLPSWKRMLTQILNLDINAVSMQDLQKNSKQEQKAFQLQYELLSYVKNNRDPNVIVIDADDLQNNSSSILQQFCDGLGLPYSDSLLKWPNDPYVMKSWKVARVSAQGNFLENEGGFYAVALKSTQFQPAKPLPERRELSEDLQKAADEAMPFYEKMKEMCLKP